MLSFEEIMDKVDNLQIQEINLETPIWYMKEIFERIDNVENIKENSFWKNKLQQEKVKMLNILQKRKKQLQMDIDRHTSKLNKLENIREVMLEIIPEDFFYETFNLGQFEYLIEEFVNEIVENKYYERFLTLQNQILKMSEEMPTTIDWLREVQEDIQCLSMEIHSLEGKLLSILNGCKENIDKAIFQYVSENSNLIDFRIRHEIFKKLEELTNEMKDSEFDNYKFISGENRKFFSLNDTKIKYPLEMIINEKSNVDISILKSQMKKKCYEMIVEAYRFSFVGSLYSSLDEEKEKTKLYICEIESRKTEIENLMRDIGDELR